MPKITEVRVSYRAVVQPAQYEPTEAQVSLVAMFGEGEEPEANDIELLSDMVKAGVNYQLGLETVGTAEVEVVQREANPPVPSGASSGDQPPSNRGRRGSSVSANVPASVAQSVPAEETPAAAPSSSRGRRGANPPMTASTPETVAAAPNVSTGSRRGRGVAPLATSAATTASPSELKQSDISKAVSELGRKKGHALAFGLLEKFGVKRADQVKPEDFEAFVAQAREIVNAD